MKKILLKPSTFLFVSFCLIFGHCKKKPEEPIDKSNITLYDKPLSVIRECLQGKWELIYAKGGFTGNDIQYFHDDFWVFKNDNIQIIDSGKVYIDTTIQWKIEPLNFNSSQSTYTLNYKDRSDYPYIYYVERIHHDTLSIVDYGYDGFGYYFTKSN